MFCIYCFCIDLPFLSNLNVKVKATQLFCRIPIVKAHKKTTKKTLKCLTVYTLQLKRSLLSWHCVVDKFIINAYFSHVALSSTFMSLSTWVTLLLTKQINHSSSHLLCLCLSQCWHLCDGCLTETGVLASASLTHCRRAHKIVQPASWETAVPELPVGLEADRLVCRAHSFSLCCTLTAVHQPLLALVLVLWYYISSKGAVACCVGALDCTATHSPVRRHWNQQTFASGWGWVDLLLMWTDHASRLKPLQSFTLI